MSIPQESSVLREHLLEALLPFRGIYISSDHLPASEEIQSSVVSSFVASLSAINQGTLLYTQRPCACFDAEFYTWGEPSLLNSSEIKDEAEKKFWKELSGQFETF